MTNRLPLSIFIIAKDEADRISPVIRSVRDWAHEVLVVDSGSTDNTVQLSEELGATVMYRRWQGYGPQKTFAESKCTQNWVLNIDADEEVSPALRDEIIALFTDGNEPERAGYHIPIRLCFPQDSAPRPFAPSNDPVRLYRRDKAGFKDELVHDSVVVNDGEPVGKLTAPIHHRCFRNHHHAIEKINMYSSMQAQDMLDKGRHPHAARLIAEPFLAFLKAMFLRRYILFGVQGFTESILYAFARTIRLAKAREAFAKAEQLAQTSTQDSLDSTAPTA